MAQVEVVPPLFMGAVIVGTGGGAVFVMGAVVVGTGGGAVFVMGAVIVGTGGGVLVTGEQMVSFWSQADPH